MMVTTGSILVADDEETFLESTCRLLQREGFECLAATNAEEAIENLRRKQFDLLVADIRMPRNPDLRVVREAHELDRQMPVILVTGYPSLETAIRSVEMSVVAYMTKPIDFDELIPHIRTAVSRSRNRRVIAATHERLKSCLTDLEVGQARPLKGHEDSESLVSMATIRTLASGLSDLLDLYSRTVDSPETHNLCELLDCPQEPDHRQAIVKSIQVLKETKGTFKSKKLGELRAELEGMLGKREGSSCRE
jgi:DNA-binding response OmpR family regulator